MTRDLENAFAELRDIEQAFARDMSLDNRELFRKKLEVITSNFVLTIGGASSKRLADAWLIYLGPALADGYTANNVRYQLDKFVSFVHKHKLVNYITEQSENLATLAFVCMCGLELKRMGCTYHPVHNVGNILKKWLGIEEAELAMKSLESYVNILYGQHVWDLYNTDVAREYQLPCLIWNAGVPLKGSLQGPDSYEGFQLPALPSNLSV